MKRMERVKLYPTERQTARLQRCLDVCRQVYNLALEQRKDAWRYRRLQITYKMQYRQLTELRGSDPRIRAVYRELQDAALHKLELAFAAFFRRLRHHQKPGFPRFRSIMRYNSLEFPHGERALKFGAASSKLHIPGVGAVRLRKGRDVPRFGRAIISRNVRGWFATFECERPAKPLFPTHKRIGIDVGVATFYATSDGGFAPNLRLGAKKGAAMARAQRRVARRTRGSANQRKALRLLARAHDMLRWARRDWHHKMSRELINTHDTIVLEKLMVANMTRSARGTLKKPGSKVAAKASLNKTILDAGWRQFANMLIAKAEEAGRQVMFVKSHYSSQTCAFCGYVAAANRRTQNLFVCLSCGHRDHADSNAAKVILLRAELPPAGSSAEVSDCQDPRSELSRARTPVAQLIA